MLVAKIINCFSFFVLFFGQVIFAQESELPFFEKSNAEVYQPLLEEIERLTTTNNPENVLYKSLIHFAGEYNTPNSTPEQGLLYLDTFVKEKLSKDNNFKSSEELVSFADQTVTEYLESPCRMMTTSNYSSIIDDNNYVLSFPLSMELTDLCCISVIKNNDRIEVKHAVDVENSNLRVVIGYSLRVPENLCLVDCHSQLRIFPNNILQITFPIARSGQLNINQQESSFVSEINNNIHCAIKVSLIS